MTTIKLSNIIDKEKELFNIQDAALKTSARLVYHNKKCLGKKSFNIDYNIPEIRCSYLYRYSNINAGLTRKYFKKLVKVKEVKSTLQNNEHINICSLGGGPGIDVFSIVNTLMTDKKFPKKVIKATVLDICEGWENSFALVNDNHYQKELIKVDLLDSLPLHVQEVIRSADIICIVRFISAISGDKRYRESLKVIGSLMKTGTVILYIDSFNEEMCTEIEDIFKSTGFETILGPLHEKYLDWATIQADKDNKSKSELYKEVFGCVPQTAAKFSVFGCIKTIATSKYTSIVSANYSGDCFCDDCETESKVLNISLEPLESNLENNEAESEMIYSPFDKYTQTETQVFTNTLFNGDSTMGQIEELSALIEALSDLLNVIARKKKKHMSLSSYCCNKCHHI